MYSGRYAWAWLKSYYLYFGEKHMNIVLKFLFSLFYKLVILAESIVAFMIISFVTSQMVRVGLMASTAIIFTISNPFYKPIVHCFPSRLRPYGSLLNRAIPWVGVDSAYLSRTNRSSKDLILSFFFYLFLTYFTFGSSYYLWTELFLKGHLVNAELNDSYFGIVGLMEFLSLLFMRTRLSLRYFPRFLLVANVLFLYYILINFYAFADEALLLLTVFCLFVFFLFLLHEIAALEWNPFGPFTPTNNNPRQAYIPVLIRNYSLGFDISTIFYAPWFRNCFSTQEQEYINQENEILPFDFSTLPPNHRPPQREMEPIGDQEERNREVNVQIEGQEEGNGEGYDMRNIQGNDSSGDRVIEVPDTP